MDPGLETAVLDVLARAESGADVSTSWIRTAYPRWWQDIDEFLRVHRRLQAGRPVRDRLGPYRVRQRLGEGGMGTVFLAELEERRNGLAAGTRVALKVVHPHLLARPRFLERTLREARLGAAVVHPNVVRTLDVDIAAGPPHDTLYLVTEFVDGQNLRGLLDELGAVPEELCRHVAAEVLAALAAIHASGAVHRDLKPENVLLARDGAVKVTDLGAARLVSDDGAITAPGEFLGSLLYAAPEQILRPAAPVDARADLYALGVVLHEMAAGSHPFADGPEADTRRDGPPRLGPRVSAFLAEFTATLLAHDPAQRFPSAAAALDALRDGDASRWWRESRAAHVARRQAPDHAGPALVGREAEIAEIHAAWRDVLDGGLAVVRIEGEAGVGKSRLVGDALARLAAGGADFHRLVVRHAPGAPPSASAAAWVAAIREHLAGEDSDTAVARLLAGQPELIPAFLDLVRGDTRSGAPALSPDARTAAVAAVVRSLAKDRPVVLVTEDIHFADADAPLRLGRLIGELAEERVLVVATSRAPAAPAAAPHARTRTIALGRLCSSDLRALLEAILGSAAAATRAFPAVLRRSDGNPYFVVEFVRHLRETGALVPAGGGTWDVVGNPESVPLPETLRALVARRIDALDPGDRALVGLAACEGFTFDPDVLARAAKRPKLQVLRDLARIERGHRLVRGNGPRWTFDHHVVQEVLAASATPAEARERHAAIADAIEWRALATAPVRGDTALAIFDHWLRAERGPAASAWLDAALRQFEATCPAAEAVSIIRRALALPGAVPDARRAEVMVELAPYLDVLSRRDEEHRVLRDALELAAAEGPPRVVACARAELARCLLRMGRSAEAYTEALRALDEGRRCHDDETVERAHQAAGSALASLDRVGDALPHLREQLRIARAAGSPTREADAEDTLGTTVSRTGDAAAAIGHFRRALALVRGLPSPPAYAGQLRLRLAQCLVLVGLRDEVPALLEEQLRLSRRIGDHEAEAWTQSLLGEELERRGDRAAGLDLARRATDAARRGSDPSSVHVALRHLAAMLYRAGDVERTLALSAEAREIADRLEIRPGTLLCHAIDALALSAVGAHEEALAASRATGEAADALPYLRGRRVARFVQASCANGGRGDARLFADALRLAQEEGDRRGIAAAWLHLALVQLDASDDAGERTLTEALAATRANGEPDLVARCLARLAAIERASPDAVRDEIAPHAAALPVTTRLAVEHDLWRATGDAQHLTEARRQLDVLRAGAPARFRTSVVARVPLHRAVASG